MSIERRSSQRTHRCASLILICAAATFGLVGTAAADESAPSGPAAGMRMRPPQHSSIEASRTDTTLEVAPQQGDSRAKAAAELSEEAVPLPGGGTKINLRGNFRAAVTRKVGPVGPTGHECSETGAAQHE
jgi:hypothetical protein